MKKESSISITPASRARASRKKRSEVLFSNTLESLTNKMNSYEVCFVRGKPLTGKSTLLRQYHAMSPLEASYELRFAREINLEQFAAVLERVLGVKTSESLALDQRFEDCLVQLEERKALLLLHRADRIKDIESFFEKSLEFLIESKILSSCVSLPKFESSQIFEFGIQDHNGFSLEETKIFIQNAQMSFDTEADFSDSIFELTKGNPYLLRLLLAQPLVEKRSIREADLKNFSVKRNEYYERIIQQLNESEQTFLTKASLIQFDFDRIKEMALIELPESQIEDIIDLGLLRKLDLDQLSMDADLAKFIQSRATKSTLENHRKELLALLSNHETVYSSQIERTVQLKHLGLLQEAAVSFDLLLEEAVARGDDQLLIEISESLVEIISLKSFKRLLKSYRSLGRYDDGLQVFSVRSVLPSEEIEVCSLKTDLLLEVGRREEAQGTLRKLLELYPHDSLERGLILYDLAYSTLEPVERLRLARAARSILNLIHFQDPMILLNLYLVEGFALDDLVQIEDSALAYQKAFEISHSMRDQHIKLSCLSNFALSKYQNGDLNEAFDLFSQLKQRSIISRNPFYTEIANQHFVTLLTDSGQIDQAIKMIPAKLLSAQHDRLSKNQIHTGAQHLVLLLLSNRFEEAKALFEKYSRSSAFGERPISKGIEHLLIIADRLKRHENIFLDFERNLTIHTDTPILQLFFLHKICVLALMKGVLPPKEIITKSMEMKGFFAQRSLQASLNCFYLALMKIPRTSEEYRRSSNFPGHSLLLSGEFFRHAALAVSLFNEGNSVTARLELETAQGFVINLNPDSLERQVFAALEESFNADKVICGETFSERIRLRRSDGNEDPPTQINRSIQNDKISSDLIIDFTERQLSYKNRVLRFNAAPQAIKLLAILGKSGEIGLDKESLSHLLWNEKYNPLVHDTRVYTAVRRTRRLLDDYQIEPDMLYEDDGKYFFRKQISIKVIE